MGKIYGSNIPKLRLGHLITGPFEQIGNFHPAAPVEFGTLLKFTANKLHYVAMKGDETDANLFAGIALVEKAGTPNAYPGTKTRYEAGEPGNVLKVGNVAVIFSTEDGADADDIIEGGAVYLDNTGKVTQAADNGKTGGDKVEYLLLPNLVFTGDVFVNEDSVTLVGVRKLY